MDLSDDGWENLSITQPQQNGTSLPQKYSEGRCILQNQYSLEPDMISGWIPKLPSCPIPLSYQNPLVQTIKQKILLDSRYPIVYQGPKHINSVQMHRRNTYRWKYRDRYEVQVNAIKEAIQNVGRQENFGLNEQKSISFGLTTLTFDSDFESGNLQLAIQVKRNQYDCFIRNDTNTLGHTNWYYFKINNRRQVGPIQINICNIIKNKNLYGRGMTPYTLIQTSEDQQSCAKWQQRKCYDVNFVQRLCRYGSQIVSHQLQFKYNFERQNQEVYFAYSTPYSYSQLQFFLDEIKSNKFVKLTQLCESFSGLEVPLLNITNQSLRNQNKITAIITGRIHPGQTNSSYVLQGFIRDLISDNQKSRHLLAYLNFYIIPMINPDGVVAGNYRTNLSGKDLNRKFYQIGKYSYPQINGLANLVQRLKKQHHKIQFYLDFHSHSAKKDLFCYGPEHQENSIHYFRSRIFAKLIQKNNKMFKYEKSLFLISQHKKTTGRAYMLEKQGIPMTFTFQISNGLYTSPKDVQRTYNKQSLLEAGSAIYKGLYDYSKVYYLKNIPICTRMPKNAIYRSRMSMKIMQKDNSLQLRKSIGLPNQSFIELKDQQSSEKLQDIFNEIINQKKEYNYIEDLESDNEFSEQDIEETQRLQFLRNGKMYHLKNDKQDNLSLKKINSNKGSLKNLTNVLSSSLKAKHRGTQRQLKTSFQQKLKPMLKKYKKMRIYYDETHPPNTKKILENRGEEKKALKQKSFPIFL